MKYPWLAPFTWILWITMLAACSSTAERGSEQPPEAISLAYTSAYQVTWSGNSTLPAGCPATCSGSTCICGTQSNACIGGPGWGDRTFTDTSPVNGVVTRVHLDIQQIGCSAGTVSAFLNGTRLGAYQPQSACACNACDPPQTVDSAPFPNGIPGYNYGGVNTLRLVAESGSPCIAKIDIRVDGTTARVAVTPSTQAFPAQRVGTTSAAQAFSVQNQGSEELEVTSFETSGPFILESAPSTPFKLAAGQSATASVQFAPTASGAASGSFVVSSTDPRGPVVVNLSGTGVAPSMNVSPNPLDLGAHDIGANTTGTVTVTNIGTDALNISEFAIDGANANEFTLVSPPPTPRIPPGGNLALTVRFAPTGHGTRGADLVISSDAAENPTRAVLRGTGLGPAMEIVTTSPIDFGATNVNTVAAPQNAVVQNVGERPLRILSAALSTTEFTTSTTFPIDVAPGARAQIALAFRPTAAGARADALVLTSNDPLNPTGRIELTGIGTSPTLGVDPASVDFGDVRIGGGSPTPRTLTLSNKGNGALVISGAVVGGADAARFALSPANLPRTLLEGETMELTVSYSPVAVGAHAANLTISSNDLTSGTAVIPLAGKGVSSAISLTPMTLDFGAHLTGRASTARTAEISNTGTAPLNITELTLGGAQAAMFEVADKPEVPLAVAPGAKLTLSFTFKPTAVGNAVAELTVKSDDPNTPTAVLALKGSAVSQLFSVTPTSLDFGVVRVGSKPAGKTVSITNNGGDPITLTDATLEGPGAAAFQVTRAAGPLAPGKSVTVTVTYAAAAPADASATLKIGASDAAIPKAQVTVRGRAVSQLLSTDVSALDFGRVKVGEKPAGKPVTVTNQSNTALAIAGITVDNDQFVIGEPFTTVAPGGSATFIVSFHPTRAGDTTGTVKLALTDGATDEVSIAVTGSGDPADARPPSSDDSDIYGGGCGCGSAGHSSRSYGAIGAFIVVALLRRRRRMD